MNNNSLLQLSAGKGPTECSRVVALVLEQLLKEARKNNIYADVINKIPGTMNGTLLSVTVKLSGNELVSFIQSWIGTIQWIGQSPYRKMHKRKNWFITIQRYDTLSLKEWNTKEVSFKTCRAAGPGGQHVNKTETAVRATHIPSGISVLCMTSRSQHQNKKEAVERLKEKVQSWQWQQAAIQATQQWQQHHYTKRGNAVRTFTLPLF
ncbi:peptide chain release factor H [Chitinophaga sp. MD30]|nr:peptide chain release factor H [Chitinophaga sp. MD30]